MPCSDGEGRRPDPYLDAMLCAVLTQLERRGILREILFSIDEKEAGVSKRRIKDWWANHKEEDRRRKNPSTSGVGGKPVTKEQIFKTLKDFMK